MYNLRRWWSHLMHLQISIKVEKNGLFFELFDGNSVDH